MTKLHEIIAVEPDLKAQAETAKNEALRDAREFGLFTGMSRTYQPITDGGERFPNEVSLVKKTVGGLLRDVRGAFSNYIDVTLQKEVANLKTGADVVVDGAIIYRNVPTPVLLNLENQLQKLLTIYEVLPTLDPAEQWSYNAQEGLWVTPQRETFKTKKVMRNHVKAEATAVHPAQVEVYTEDERVGTWTAVIKSGMIPTTTKSEYITRIEKLIRAVKAARQRANDIEIETTNYSNSLFAYINGD